MAGSFFLGLVLAIILFLLWKQFCSSPPIVPPTTSSPSGSLVSVADAEAMIEGYSNIPISSTEKVASSWLIEKSAMEDILLLNPEYIQIFLARDNSKNDSVTLVLAALKDTVNAQGLNGMYNIAVSHNGGAFVADHAIPCPICNVAGKAVSPDKLVFPD